MITLAALATKFLERPGLAKSTLRSYESTIKRRVSFGFS